MIDPVKAQVANIEGRFNRYKALSAVHTALDTATMAKGMSEADILRLSDMMKQIRVMKDHK